VHTNGQIDCLAFQRAPRFCENTDRAMATGCIQIPAALAPGHYIFQWYWIFNSGSPPYVTCWDAQVITPGGTGSRGGGGLIGYANVSDDLGNGGSTCANNWAAADTAAGMTIPDMSAPTQPPTSPPDVPVTPVVPPPTTPTTDSVAFGSNPAIIPAIQNSTFPITIQYYATSRRAITVDILNTNSNPPVWYGKAETYVSATTSLTTLKLNVQVYTTLPAAAGYLLRAWIVNDTIYDRWVLCTSTSPPSDCTTAEQQPWTQELDRSDFPVVATTAGASYEAASNCPSSSGKYTGGEIAATFFGTLLGMLAIFAAIYFLVLRKQQTSGK